MDFTWLDNRLLVALSSAALGILATLIGRRIINKRGRLVYSVRHDRVGVSGDDAVFGSVQVLWNDNPVQNLYASGVELTNASLKDFENVRVKVFTNDTILLNERTEFVGTTHFPTWTEEYATSLVVPPGQEATPQQVERYSHGREYLLPTLNRGQTVRFAFLTACPDDIAPSIWLDVLHKGVKLQYRVFHQEVLGVPQPDAALAGVLLGIGVVVGTVLLVDTVWVAALVCLAFGFVAQIPGAALVKGLRWIRGMLGD